MNLAPAAYVEHLLNLALSKKREPKEVQQRWLDKLNVSNSAVEAEVLNYIESALPGARALLEETWPFPWPRTVILWRLNYAEREHARCPARQAKKRAERRGRLG